MMLHYKLLTFRLSQHKPTLLGFVQNKQNSWFSYTCNKGKIVAKAGLAVTVEFDYKWICY
jgi:hypothetical protein